MSVDEAAQKRAELEERVAELEAIRDDRAELVERAKRSIQALQKQRRRGGAKTWDLAQRTAVRFVLLSVGCVGVVTGGYVFGEFSGNVALVFSFGVLAYEGLR